MTLPFYPFYWGDYSSKTFTLTQGQHGAYMLLLRHIYTDGGPIEHEQRYSIAKALLPEEQKNTDFVLEKFFEKKEGYWRNSRADEVIKAQGKKHQARVTAGKKRKKQYFSNGAAKDEQNLSNQNQNQNQNQIEVEEGTNVPFMAAIPEPANDLVKVAIEKYNLLAKDIGGATSQKISSARRSKLNARLKDCDGMVGWEAALAKARASPISPWRS